MKLLKIFGLGIAVVAAMAVVVVLGRVARAQTIRERPLIDMRLHEPGGSQLGVSIRDVDQADVAREKLSAPTGAAVEDVEAGSPAAKAGVKAGDVFVMFDGEKVRSARHLTRLVEETPAGRKVEAVVMRNGEKVTLEVAPEPAQTWPLRLNRELRDLRVPERFELALPDFGNRRDLFLFGRGAGRLGRLGVDVDELTDQLGDYFGVQAGLLVTTVDEGTPGKTAGLRAGDVITRINGQSVRTATELRRLLADSSGDITITIVRDKKEQTLTAKFGDETSRPRIVRRRV